MTGLALDRLSREDAEILRLAHGAIRGHTCKVLILEPRSGSAPPTLAALRAHIAARLHGAPRFRRRVVHTPLRVANPVWLDDPNFDIAAHVTLLAAEPPVDRPTLQRIVAERMADPLDPSRPLWHLDLVEGLEDGAAALIWRVHHCLADGTTCIRLASALLWGDDPAPDTEESAGPFTWQPERAPGAARLMALGVAERAGGWGRALRRRPRRPIALNEIEHVLDRELRPGAALTPLAAPVGPARAVAFAQVGLEDCRRASKAIDEGVTVNDMVLSILAGAMGSWLARHAGAEDAIRVKIPVSLHQRQDGDNVANHNSYFFVDLPVSEPDPIARVLAVHRETEERKLSRDAETLYRLGLHPLVARWAMSPKVFTFNVSNVRGPREDVFVLGARVRELYSIAEIAQHHALRVAVISAAGSLFFGLCADRGAVSDLAALAAGIERASEELLQLVG